MTSDDYFLKRKWKNMKCTYCGFESDKNDLFCGNCGRRIETNGTGFNNVPPLTNEGNNVPVQSPVSAVPPPPPAPKNNNSGKKTGVIVASIAAVVCVIIICITVIVVASKPSSTVDKITDDTTTTEAKDFNTPAAKEDDKTEQASKTVKIYAGTRCKVMDDLDGSKSLALRPEPSRSGEAKAWAGKGNYVTVMENYYGTEYISISLVSEGDTYYGWVLAEYLYPVSDSEGIEKTEYKAGTDCRVVNDDGLNVWKKPRKSEGSYLKVPYGTIVEILSDYNINDNGYVYVMCEGKKGWMNAEYLEIYSGGYYPQVTTTKATTAPTTTTEPTTEQVKSGVTTEQARKAFLASQEAFKFFYNDMPVDVNESVNGYSVYYKVTHNDYTSIGEVKKELKKYLIEESADMLVNRRYMQCNGNLYFDNGGYGLEEAYFVEEETIREEIGYWTYELKCRVETYGDYSGEETLCYRMEQVDGNYVFNMDIYAQAVNF